MRSLLRFAHWKSLGQIIGGVVILMTIFSGCDVFGGGARGACIVGTGVTASCGDDETAGRCDAINGEFNEGRTCRDLGFGS